MFHLANNYIEKNRFAAPILIALIVCITYVSSIPNALVLDDPSQVTTNVQVTSFNIPKIFLGSSFGVSGTTKAQGVYYKPLMTTSYAILYKLTGSNPSSFHILQILLHAINAMLVYYLFKKFSKPLLALFLALIFAIHPLQSESVLYISALQEPLFFFFGALGFLITTRNNLSKKDMLIASGLFLLSILSKETGVLFIMAAILYGVLVQRDKKGIIKLTLYLVPFLTLYGTLRLIAVGIIPSSVDKPYPMMRLTLMERLLNIPAMFYYYSRNFVAPFDFAVAEHWVIKSLTFQDFFLPLFICLFFLVCVFGFYILLRRKKSTSSALFIFFTFWFLLGMVAHLNIFPLDVTVADRWFYFPMVGLLGMGGILITKLKLEQKNVIIVVSIVILSLLFVRTFLRTLDWRDGLTLASHDIQYSKNSFPLENNLAFELINAGRYNEALIHAKRSVTLGPWWWLNWNNLGVIYRHKGYTEDPKYYKDAEKSFRKAVENGSSFYLPYENLAELLTNYDTPQNAQAFLVKTSKKMPLSPKLWFDLALTQLLLDDKKGALQASAQAKLLLPQDAQISALNNALLNNQKILLQKPKY